MNLSVYLPMAVHPDSRSVLLIGFGVGCTARTLADTGRLQSIDVVDISRDILDRSNLLFPEKEENPLHDPRVRIHVEDGRFFLQTSERRFDLITSEPPPPVMAGVVNLYSEEYFRLIYDRLNDGGIVTYWFPVDQMSVSASKSIARAFCNVFENCSLWTGRGFDWMLVGIRKSACAPTKEQFSAQWRDEVVVRQMRLCGFESPGQLGTTFLMDADGIRKWTQGTPPLADNYPKRISDRTKNYQRMNDMEEEMEKIMRASIADRAFENSAFIRSIWPEAVRKKTEDFFRAQELLNDLFLHPEHWDPDLCVDDLRAALEKSD